MGRSGALLRPLVMYKRIEKLTFNMVSEVSFSLLRSRRRCGWINDDIVIIRWLPFEIQSPNVGFFICFAISVSLLGNLSVCVFHWILCLRSQLLCLVFSDLVEVLNVTERWMAKIQILYVGLLLHSSDDCCSRYAHTSARKRERRFRTYTVLSQDITILQPSNDYGFKDIFYKRTRDLPGECSGDIFWYRKALIKKSKTYGPPPIMRLTVDTNIS